MAGLTGSSRGMNCKHGKAGRESLRIFRVKKGWSSPTSPHHPLPRVLETMKCSSLDCSMFCLIAKV